MVRKFIDAPLENRCQWDITLKDGSKAQCGRRHVDGRFCRQHAKMAAETKEYSALNNNKLISKNTTQ